MRGFQRAEPAHVLTTQERRVLRLIALGCPDKIIAARLRISERTVRFHVSEAQSRLGASGRAHTLALALARGEIRPPPLPRLHPPR